MRQMCFLTDIKVGTSQMYFLINIKAKTYRTV